MKLTHHSEYGKLKTVFIKRPNEAFISDQKLSSEWKDLNYLSRPDLILAEEEYQKFEVLLQAEGVELKYFPEDHSVTLDSIYCRDASLATDYGMILCNMGKVARKPEPAASMHAFLTEQIPILGIIQPPGTVEGGDVAWLDDKTLAVGHTYRTNADGIRQLKELLEPHGISIIVADMPHYKGPSDVFHLMSVFSPVDKDLAVVYSPLMPISFRQYLLDRGISFVEVPESEWDSMGCNVLALSPRNCLMVSGNPLTQKRLEEAGCQVHTYTGNEISIKGGGGPTCLTRPLLREI
ncbi:MAG: arginine deiminase family protein [Cyclobacteriaceae bacterium]|jgi:N-dimethylarginine dimethylaminohydrolase|nr:arginine deiminase family protein [Cyclobacteriaceae bacterium]